MFDALLEWFNNALNFVIKWFTAVYQYGHTAWVWVAAFVVSLVAIFTDTMTWILARAELMFQAVTNLGTATSTITQNVSNNNVGDFPMQALGLANYFSPVQETLDAAGFLFALWIIAVTIRIIKSFVPTVS